jgi:excisionase family DNA binding protein
MRIDDLPELATPREVAQVLRCTETKVKKLCNQDHLGYIKHGRDKLIKPAHVRQYIERNEQCPGKDQDRESRNDRTGNAGTSSPTNAGTSGGLLRVSAALNMLDNGSLNGQSGSKDRKAPVIPMNG